MKLIKKISITIINLTIVTGMFILGENLINKMSSNVNSLYGIMFGLIYIAWFIIMKDEVWA